MTKPHATNSTIAISLDPPVPSVAAQPGFLSQVEPAPGSVASRAAWINPVSGDWNDGADWSTGAAPGVFSTVAISAAGGYAVTVDTFSAAYAVTVNGAGATLAIGGAGTLTVGTDIGLAGATLALSNGGSLAAQTLTMGVACVLSASGTSTVAAALDIAGSIALAAGSLLELQDGGTITGLVSGAGTLAVDGGSLAASAASMAGASTVLLQAGTLAVAGAGGVLNESFVLDGGTLSLAASSTATLTAPLTLVDAGQFDVSGSGSVTLEGAVSVSGSATIGGDVTTDGELIFGLSTGYDGAGGLGHGTLTTNGITIVNEASGGGAELSVNGTWTNDGTVYDRGLIDSQGSIINAAGGSFFLFDDAAQISNVNGPGGIFSNAGTLAKTSGTGTSYIQSSVLNSGLIDVLSGELDLAAGGVLRGKLEGAGTLALGGHFTTILSVLNAAGDPHIVVDGTLEILGASGTLTGVLTWDNATLQADAGVDVTVNAAEFASVSKIGFGGAGTITTTGTLAETTLTLQQDVTWMNTGDATVYQIDDDYLTKGTISIVNEADATLTLAQGASPYGHVKSGFGTLTNNGTLLATGSGQETILDVTLNSSGVFDATGSGLFLGDGGTLGGILNITAPTDFAAGNFYLGADAFANMPNFTVGKGADVDFTTGGAVSATGTFGGEFSVASGVEVVLSSLYGIDGGITGMFALANDSMLNITSNLIIGIGHTKQFAGLTVSGPGTFSTSGDTTIYNTLTLENGATWTNSGTAVVNGNISTDSNENNSTTIINGASGVLMLNNTTGDYIGFGGSVLNNGLIADSGDLYMYSGLTNNGTISAAMGTVSIGLNIMGNGILLIGSYGGLSVEAVQAGQTVDFMASDATADLGIPLDFLGTITGFGTGDVIDLVNAPETAFSYANGILTVMDDTTTEASLHFGGSYSTTSFSFSSDNGGGSLISFK